MNLSKSVAVVGWGSLFAISWMMIVAAIATDGRSIFFFVFFLVVSVMASIISSYPTVPGEKIDGRKNKE